MKKRRLGFALSTILSVTLALGACSSSESTNGKSDEPLQIWAMGTEGQKLEDFLKDFEKESAIDVDVLAIPWGEAHDKLLTAVASGDGPDVLQIGNTWVSEFAEAGTFLDLTDRLDNYPNLSQDNFFESTTATTVYEDKVYAVPYIIDTRLMFYRTDLLAEVGYPNGTETWEETVDATTKLAARGSGQYGIHISQNSHHIPMMMAWEHGWEYIIDKGAQNFEDPKFKAAIELYNGFFKDGSAQLEQGKDTIQGFSDGTYPMFIDGPYMVNQIKEQAPEIEGKWNVKVMPKVDNHNSMAGGSHFSVFHNTDRVEDSLKFINYMADPETQIAWYKEDFTLPTTKSAWKDPALADDPIMSVFGDQIEMTQPFPVFPEYEKIAQELLKTLEKINKGNEDIDQALSDYRDEVTSILKE